LGEAAAALMGNYDTSRRHPMVWQSTLGDMKAERTIVLRTCGTCGFSGEVDIDFMIALLGGPEMTLWDCRPPCALCGKDQHHMASPGPGTPFRPLTSDVPDSIVPLPARAWMARWLGRR
jgi:hypothetical protein